MKPRVGLYLCGDSALNNGYKDESVPLMKN